MHPPHAPLPMTDRAGRRPTRAGPDQAAPRQPPLEVDPLLVNEFAQVAEGVAHPAQSRVDADPGGIGDLLEAQIPVNPHNEDLPLFFGQTGDQLLDLGQALLLHQLVLGMQLGIAHAGQGIPIIIRAHQWHAAVPTKMVNTEVVGNAQNPGQKLAFFVVATGLKGLHGLHKRVLEQILGQFLMPDQLVNGGENAGFVAVH